MNEQPFLDALAELQPADRAKLKQFSRYASKIVGERIENRPFTWFEREKSPEGFEFDSAPPFEPVWEKVKNGRLTVTARYRHALKRADEVYTSVLDSHNGLADWSRELANLRAARDAAEEVSATYQETLEHAHGEIRRVLNAWAFAAAGEAFENWPLPAAFWEISERQPPEETPLDFHRRAYRYERVKMGHIWQTDAPDTEKDFFRWRVEQLAEKFTPEMVLVGEAERLWAQATSPHESSPSAFRSILNPLGDLLNVPQVLTRSAHAGLLYYASGAAKPAKKLERLCFKRLAYKQIQRAVLLDEVLPEWADLETEAEETTQQGRDTRYADKRLESAKKSVAVTLLISADDAANGDFVLDPKWHGKSEKCFFKAVEKEDKFPRNWPAIKRQLTDNMETPPYGRGAEKWEPDAQAWAEELSIPPFLFENRKT